MHSAAKLKSPEDDKMTPPPSGEDENYTPRSGHPLGERMTALEGQMGGIKWRLSNIEGKMGNVESKLDRVKEDLEQFIDRQLSPVAILARDLEKKQAELASLQARQSSTIETFTKIAWMVAAPVLTFLIGGLLAAGFQFRLPG
jgi:hypothetical protein